ncbi:MAG: ABC transporter ATP-binding protein [Beutenbergiaceae bacterium]
MHEVEMRGITKTFPGVVADRNVDLQVPAGKIHALMGENGAGKSILMSILAGLYRPDEGEIYLRGQRMDFHSPLDAINAGIGMVFQEFQLFESMTIAENIIYREEPVRWGLVDRATARKRIKAISDEYGLDVDPDARVDECPVGVLQRVEIVKALYRDAQVLILDEPTAVLTPQETDALFEVLRRLRDAGRTIVFITHKLREVMALSDNVTVLRDGEVVANVATADTDPEALSRFMTGRDVDLTIRPPQQDPGAVVLQVQGLSVDNDQGRSAVTDASFQVRRGEIVGIAGVAGNGQVELCQAIMGLRKSTAGSISLNGVGLDGRSVNDRRAAGVAYIPEDRRGTGAALELSATDNLIMGYHKKPPLRRGGLLDLAAILEFSHRLIKRFLVKIASPRTPVGTLSGGNLQKVVVAREMTHEADLLIAEQPTRGVDIGAIEFIHNELAAYRDDGRAILLVSAELSEIMSLSTRILVMYEGAIVGEVDAGQATEAGLGLMMAGATQEGELA